MLESVVKANVWGRVIQSSAVVNWKRCVLSVQCFGSHSRHNKSLWATIATMVCLCNCLIASCFLFASLLPPTVPLKLSPMPTNKLASTTAGPVLQRSTMKGTVYWPKFVIESRGTQPTDLISGSVSQNINSEHDQSRYWPTSVYARNLATSDSNDSSDSSDSSAVTQVRLQSLGLRPKAAKAFDLSVKDHKFRHNRLFSQSVSHDISQTKTLRGSLSSGDNANETNETNEANAVPTKQTLDMASGLKSISLSSESNEDRVRDVISGTATTAMEPIGSITQTFRRSPVESVKLQMESQTSRGSNFSSFAAGIPIKKHRVKDVKNVKDSLSIVSNGIYWSKQLEHMTPKAFSILDDIVWSRLINSSNFIRMSDGCGRMQNRLITLDSGVKTCARHRHNIDQIQGDIFSFYLARVLAIGNLPPATVTLTRSEHSDPLDKRWHNVRTQLFQSQWSKPIVVTKFVDNLVPAFIPHMLRGTERRLHPIQQDIRSLNVSQLTELVQWSDLIVFDYLTANLDRIVNNMVNEKWNPEMMRSPAHNLLKVNNTGLLLFLDNESGLLHGYRLLNKYDRYHQSMLSALCIFRERTAQLIERLHRNKNVVHLIESLFRNNVDQSYIDQIPFLPESNIKILNARITKVYNQIKYCKNLYKNNSIDRIF